jgi:hypothetical protein
MTHLPPRRTRSSHCHCLRRLRQDTESANIAPPMSPHRSVIPRFGAVGWPPALLKGAFDTCKRKPTTLKMIDRALDPGTGKAGPWARSIPYLPHHACHPSSLSLPSSSKPETGVTSRHVPLIPRKTTGVEEVTRMHFPASDFPSKGFSGSIRSARMNQVVTRRADPDDLINRSAETLVARRVTT